MEVQFRRTGERRYAITIYRKGLPPVEMNPSLLAVTRGGVRRIARHRPVGSIDFEHTLVKDGVGR
jgi:hypothetical protein